MALSRLDQARDIATGVTTAVRPAPRQARTGPRPPAVWYAAYGSNLSRQRFMAYIAGGRPPGARRSYMGARDKTEPAADRPGFLGHDIFFASSARVWGGGAVSFLASGVGASLGRLYLVSAEQFDDVVAQENGGEAPGDPVDLASAMRDGAGVAGPGSYDGLMCLGRVDDLPVFTFTTTRHVPNRASAPGPDYLATIARGLTESAGLSVEDAVRYLTGYPGADALDPSDVLEAVLARWRHWYGD